MPQTLGVTRTQEHLEDLASRLDAGLREEGARPGEGIVPALRRRLSLREWEWAALTAAETAGSLPAVLRHVAAARGERAALRRRLVEALAYPLLVLGMGGVIAVMMARSGLAPGGWIWLSAGLLILGLLAIGWLVLRLRDPLFQGDRVPLVGRLSRCAGEIPYLVALQALYAAGVSVRQAHPEAAAAAAIAWVKARLFLATTPLSEGESLSAALARHDAVTPETLTVLRNGESAGDLEGALGRAIARRSEEYRCGMRRTARVLGAAAYVYAAGSVFWIAVHFYGGRLAGLR